MILDHLITFCVGAVIGGCVAGKFCFYYGRRLGIITQRTASLRRRRPVNITIDYDYAVAALKNSGYKVVRAQEHLH